MSVALALSACASSNALVRPSDVLITCPREPAVPEEAFTAKDGQQIYEEWNEDVRVAGANCRLKLDAMCKWYAEVDKKNPPKCLVGN
jgi:hypothetical protein